MNLETKNGFSFVRVRLLMKRHFEIHKKFIVTGIGALLGMTIVFKLSLVFLPIDPHNGRTYFDAHLVFFNLGTFLIMIMGYVFTSSSFRELNRSGYASNYYSLPASSFEKLASTWLILFVGYTFIGLLLVFFLMYTMKAFLQAFDEQTLLLLWHYFILQSVFLFGAVHFKANEFLSTLVSLLVLFSVTWVIFLAFKTFIPELELESIDYFGSLFPYQHNPLNGLLLSVLISGIFFWLSLKRLKNRQIGR